MAEARDATHAPQTVARAPGAAAAALARAGIDPVLARIYAARGVNAPEDLDTRLAMLPPPSRLMNAGAAGARLADAIARGERIVIVADYDADGATACALGLRALKAMGAIVDFVVPNRFVHGYGLTPGIVAEAAARAPRIIVTVDTGIASVDGVRAAAARGIDVIVTDHHLPGPVLPAPAIIVNPNQRGCPFPSRNLAGVGVMFYVLLATRAELRARGGREEHGGGSLPNLAALLDLVALGTIADVVPLDAVNRALCAQGLARIRAGRCQSGIAALFAVARRDASRASARDLAFVVGPRINAAGRLDDMTLGIRLLASDDDAESRRIAARLAALNDERRAIEASMRDDALAALARVDEATLDARHSICLADDAWHQGVVGIVASRLKERFHRPAIVFAPGDADDLKGSGRSIDGFHLRDALERVTSDAPGVIRRFGGHAMAAGLTIGRDALPRFVAAFETVARAAIAPSALTRTVLTDGALAAGELSLPLAEAIERGVWGQGFPAPSFEAELDVLEQRVVGSGHLKLRVRCGGVAVDAMLFGRAEPVPARIRAVYTLQVDRFSGGEALTIIVDHWLPATG
jgi:single-stranded-DNA-specific exonuclease